MEQRTDREILTNRLLMLFLIDQTQRKGYRITGKVKLMKMIFQAQTKMVKDRVKAFDYLFYRWDFGPMSNEVLKDLECMLNNDLLEKQGTYIFISNKGRELLKQFSGLLETNREILGYMNRTVNEFASYSGKAIKEVTYDIPLLFGEKLIRHTKPSDQILGRIERDDARSWFLLDDDSEETLSLLMDKKACEALERGIADARVGKIQKYQPVN
ncbi:MAG: DUF4065 domain-containing protein [Candidatus Bathyarchaeota archaeon]|nr:DUF4065 domain-containing protein [Candidatus Bathyarchaeota archaeon]MDH5786757.1 DUF4065 domain-containing protein [Candidatus Bathyarchaeota archaeon]